MSIEAISIVDTLKQALEALESTIAITLAKIDLRNEAIASLRQAIATEESLCASSTSATQERLELIGHADLAINNIHIFNGYGEDVPEGRTPIYAGYPQQKAEESLCAGSTAAVQEPVAWGVHDQIALNKALETHPQPKRAVSETHKWVGLTDEDEIDWDEVGLRSLVKAVEAKLKEKNT